MPCTSLLGLSTIRWWHARVTRPSASGMRVTSERSVLCRHALTGSRAKHSITSTGTGLTLQLAAVLHCSVPVCPATSLATTVARVPPVQCWLSPRMSALDYHAALHSQLVLCVGCCTCSADLSLVAAVPLQTRYAPFCCLRVCSVC